MNTKKGYRHQRRAISPIIATVLIIAVTLVAAVAIGGFVFGLFGASASTAQVQATAAIISSTVTSAQTGSVSCASSAPSNNFVTLFNQGTASTTINLVVVQFGGTTMTVAPTGTCGVTAGSTLYLSIGSVTGATPVKGVQFTGFAGATNGAQVVFAGAFT